MGNRLYDNEFEDFLKNQANQHRMYPSDHVWRKIHGEVHGYRKWPALTIIAVFIIAALVVGTIAVKPHGEFVVQQKVQEFASPQSTAKRAFPLADNSKDYTDHLSVNNITRQTIAKVTEAIHTNEPQELSILPANESLSESNVIGNTNTTAKSTVVTSSRTGNDADENILTGNPANSDPRNTVFQDTRFIFSNNFSLSNNGGYQFNSAAYKNEFSFLRNNNSPTFNIELAASKPSVTSPLSKIGKKSSKLDFQVYVTPSISYRRLVDDVEGSLTKSYVTALPYAANYIVDLNHVIQHRPAAGYEVGFSLGYNIGKKFAIRSGVQFNTRQYNIDAFVHSSEPATVALSADNSNLVLNTVSGFRNIDGSKPIELKNRYYEIAVPIGIDWRPVNKKFAWGIAAAIQPTYTFDKEPFIITSNYKNYADGSQLMRNWNINANIETYLGYNTGKYRWQIGPQLRYQLLPTMANSFPIREYPVDLGIKLGLIRSLR